VILTENNASAKKSKHLQKTDRREWLADLAGSGEWHKLRQLRSGTVHGQGRLADESGELVGSENWAITFARYLESVQWAVRPATLVERPLLFPELLVSSAPITLHELRKAAAALSDKKAAGPDGHPVEFWKALLAEDGDAATWLLEFCNACWSKRKLSKAWHLHEVALIFKKGDPSDCGNYRPICLLSAAYKIPAMIILRRLMAAGADDRLSPSQFGFRPKRGTEDALHCARRAVEEAWAHRNGSVHLLALDWRKAFDSINANGLLSALKRFGIPQFLLDIISSIYSDREFRVNECGIQSDTHKQQAGICQGCPLSPFLVIIVMTVLMRDAYEMLGKEASDAALASRLYDILYADDTLIIASVAEHAEELAKTIEKAGAEYGLSLLWGKVQAMPVCTSRKLRQANGEPMKEYDAINYLGGLVSNYGRVDSELSRRIGLASAVPENQASLEPYRAFSSAENGIFSSICNVQTAVWPVHDVAC
jgi:hypothetical protein